MGKKLHRMLIATLVVITMMFTCLPAFAATPLKITKQPVSVTVSSGTTAKVDVDATGDGLTYKWYYKNKGDKKFSGTTSFKGDSYSVKMSSSRAGRQVYCVIKDKSGESVKTNTATLSMGTTLKVSTQPKSVTVKKGATAKVTFKANGDGLKYKWYYKNKGASKFKSTTTFKGTTYSVKMSDDRDGRQVYCKITDKYGSSIKTKTVTLSQIKYVKITKQPASVSAVKGEVAKTTLTATGDGLKYTWYYKNSGSSKFSKTTSFKSNYYSVEMNSDRNGRQVYCVVTDKYGKTAKSDVVTLSLAHKWNEGVVTKEPTCTIAGSKNVTCVNCGQKSTQSIKATGHKLGSWKVIREATADKAGLERRTCSKCSFYDDREISKLATVYRITVKVDDDSYKVGVGSNGKYTLEAPKKIGYNFVGWKDSNGNAFESTGVVDKNITVYAVWELDGTDTLKDLIKRTEAGVENIKITGDIVINQPIYISYKTNIYSDGDYSLKRDPSYKGDFFVVGKDKSGIISTVLGRGAELTLGNGEGTLTLDGNRDNTTVKVNGALVFASDNAIVNIYDGVRLANNEKLENERIFQHQDLIGETVSLRAGGAAIINLNSTVNMYGGVVENNAVLTEHTTVKDENNVESKKDYSGCGGAVYNYGNFNMYGGTISNNEALRGGGLYNYRLAFFNAGTISYNDSVTYGGAISSSSTSNAETYIGKEGTEEKMLIKGNVSGSYGAAVYSNLWSPILVYENAVFEGNETPSSGGAIYTAGPLTIEGAEFINNKCEGSGGAIYHTYNNPDYSRRYLDISGTVFKGNEASLGGAITLSSSAEIGTSADILNCEFIGNKAVKGPEQPGNGGAIYITRKSEADIKGCTFDGNSARNNAGAVAIQSGAKVNVTDTDFTGNSANSGGAVYTSSQTNVTLKNVLFDGNSAILSESGSGGNGGALHVTDVSVKTDNVDFKNNSAATHGGAVYNKSCELKVDATCEFEGNTAGSHGGAIYLTYTELADKTKVPSKLVATNTVFKNNAGKSGGAVSIRSACEANITDVQLIGNEATGTDKDSLGGGAVYVGYGKLSMANVKAEGNVSAKNGGAVSITDSPVTVNGGSFDKNEGTSGGAVYVNNGANYTVAVNNTTFNENKADTAGGVYTNSKGTLELNNIDFSKNHANNNAGALYIGQAPIKLTDVDFYENHADNNAGALYVAGRELTFDSTYDFKGNSAGGHGGAIYLTYRDDATAGRIGGVLNANNMVFEGNTAKAGGAISLRSDCVVNMNGGQLLNNKATGTERDASGGGAIYAGYGKLLMENVTATGNDCDGYGGVVNSAGSDVTVTGGELSDNSAASGGAIAAYSKSDVVVSNVVLNRNNSDYANSEYDNTKGGGAVNVDGSTLDISKATFDANEASYYGGTVLAAKSTVTIDEETAFTNGKGRTGAVLGLVSSKTTIADSTFTNNVASSNGVIYATGGTLDITKVVAQDNNAVNGGVIYASSTSGKITLKESDWNNNTAKTGGVLYIKDAQVEATDFVFRNNNANIGGAVYNECGKFTVSNVEFTENSATKNSNGSAGNGGAVSLAGGTFDATADNITFKNNTAEGHAGAVYVAYKNLDNGTQVSGVLNAENVVFENNSAAVGGGAVSIRSNSEANITGGSFTNNTTEGTERVGEGGGAVYEGYGSLTMTDVTVTDNSATGFGGAVNAAGGTVDIIGGTFTGNVAGSGGAIGGSAASKITVNNAVMTENESNYVNSDYDNTKGGGAVNVSESTITLSKVTFDKNKTNYYGGTLSASASTVTIDGESVVKNSTGSTGGALCFVKSSKVTIADTNITNNNSNGNGAIYINGGSLDATNVTATDNASINGGALYASGASTKVTIANSKWNNNTSNNNGGAMVIANANVIATSVEFKNNTAKLGGAAYLEKGTLETKNVTFEENSAVKKSDGKAGNGGAVSLTGGTLTVTGDNTFKNNTAENHGGAVYVSYFTPEGSTTKTPGVLNANGGTFEGNIATFGGAISARTDCQTTLTGAVLRSNTATTSTAEGGGAIYANTNTLVLSGTTIAENTSKYYGGAIYVTDADVTINNNTQITKNTSDKGRTVYFTNKCNVTIDGATVTDHATGGDSAIYINSGSLNATDLDVSSNSAVDGGAMQITGASTKVSLKNGTWTGNNASHYGGAIHLYAGTLNVDGTEFKQNEAVLGGAIYNSSGTLTTTGALFEGNTAVLNSEGKEGNGGAITNVAGNLIGNGNDIFKNNTAAGHGGAVYNAYATAADKVTKIPGVVNITGGLFEGNTSIAGGAISTRTDCQTTLNGTVLKANKATTSDSKGEGGAIYANNSTMTLSGVTLDGNVCDYYGGAVSTHTVNMTINNNSVIKNNVGITGSALCLRDGGTYNIEGSVLNDNVATKGSGVVYINSSGTLNVTDLTATGNKNNNGGVIYASGSAKLSVTGSDFTGNTAVGQGGAVDHRSSVQAVIKNTTISGNTAKIGAGIATTGKLDLDGVTISGNAATEKGGGIYATGSSAKVNVINGSTVKTNTAPNGGGAYMEKGATLNVDASVIEGNVATEKGGGIYVAGAATTASLANNAQIISNTALTGGGAYVDEAATLNANASTFDGNVATGGKAADGTSITGDGGGIFLADSSDEGTAASKLVLTSAILKNNKAAAKGGAVSTDTDSPNLLINATSTTFDSNEAQSAGGGAVEIQNKNCPNENTPADCKIAFTNCTFTNNKCKTTGAAVEIRTSSYAKVDGLTATGNKATQNGSVFYVTSVHSRLYLTGSVEVSGNTANSGNFAYLYNNNYTNPPKIYTTYDNTATWYTDVKGNPQNVVFNATML